MGEGFNLPPPPILFVKTKEKIIRLCTVLSFYFSGSFGDIGIFYVFQLSFEGGGGYIYP